MAWVTRLFHNRTTRQAGVVTPFPANSVAVIFDMDGVLVDSEPLWHEAELDVFTSVGVPLTTALCQETTGVRIDAVVRYWHARYPWQTPSVDEVEQRIVCGVVERVRARGEPMPGARAAVAAAQQAGKLLGLASSSPLSIIDAVLDRLAVRPCFQAVRSAEKLPRGKPDPEVYLLACADLGVPPSAAIAIEDSHSGILAAHAAGMFVVAVPDPRAPPPASLPLAHVVLDSLLQFPTLLAS